MLGAIKRFFVYRFDPCHNFLQQGLRTALAVFLSILLYRSLSAYPEHYWVVLAATFIMQTRVGKLSFTPHLSVLACGILSALVAWLMITLQPWLFISAPVFALLAMAFVYYSRKGHEATVRAFFILLYAVMSLGLPLLPGGSGLQRVSFMLLGTVCALIASFTFRKNPILYFQRLLNVYRHNIAELIMLELRTMATNTSAEKRLHELRNRLLRQERELLTLAKPFSDNANYIKGLRAFAIDIGNLRFFELDDKTALAHGLYTILKPRLKQFTQTTIPLGPLAESKNTSELLNVFEQRDIALQKLGGAADE